MTWDEFKAAVDKELSEIGATGAVELEYIDINWAADLDNIDIKIDANGELSISN